MEDEFLEKILTNLRVGIAKIETGGIKNPYSATAGDKNKDGKPDSTATGKYQFLKQWLSKKGPVQGIKEFAKDTGVFSEVNSMEDFKNQPELQDAYFNYYAKKVLIPAAQKTAVKNPLNLSLDEIASQFHFQSPSVAKRSIQSGNLVSESKTNASGQKYLEVYRSGLEETGLKPISYNDIIKSKKNKSIEDGSNLNLSKEEKSIEAKNNKIKESFAKKDKAISNLDIAQGAKEKLRNKLYQEAVNNNTVDIANEYIDEENKKVDEEMSNYKNLQEVLSDSEFEFDSNPKDFNSKKVSKLKSISTSGKGDAAKAKKDFPELFKNFTILSGDYENTLITSNSKEANNFLSELNKKIKNSGGEVINSDRFDRNSLVRAIGETAYKILPDVVTDSINNTSNIVRDFNSKNLFGNKLPKRNKIDPSNFVRNQFPNIENKELSNKNSSKETSKKNVESKKDYSINPEIKEVESNEINSAQLFFDRALGLSSLSQDTPSIGKSKKELPIDAITGLALGLIGNKQAKEANIPLRTEEVSEAVKNFTAELAKRSKEGLPVEIEAKMRNDLAEAYQAGLNNIVNASAGNRATVLGNLGRLDSAKNKGLVAIQVADYASKEKAFEQYGKAIMYQNDFNARKDIANHEIQYNEAKRNQKNGAELATAGFAKLIDGIKYQKENGPGSANDMYRSYLMQNMFGFDPNMKDDGTGMKQGTKSFFDKKKGLATANLEATKKMYNKFNSLNPDQKKTVGLLTDQTSDSNQINSFMDHLVQNPDADLNKISMDNLDLATKKNDYGLLSQNRETILESKNSQENVINLSEEQLNEEGGANNPMGLLNAYSKKEESASQIDDENITNQFASINN